MSSSSVVNLENFLIPLEEIHRATDNFSQERFIGSGGFGNVYKGQLSQRWQNRTAAIKRLDKQSRQGKHEFRNELEMFSRVQHENIISFIGFCDQSNEMILVYEYAINGSLDQYLQDPNKRRCMTWTQRLKICIGAARGLNYLHTGIGEHDRIIHRDVKSSNILLDENFIAKICDFGLSKPGPRNQPNTEIHTKVAGTRFYLDPDYEQSGILRKESDVYSFGVVLFELLSGMLVYCSRSIGDDRPWSLIHLVRQLYPNELHKLVESDIRDQINSRSFDTFKEIAYQCISLIATERPTMVKVTEKLNEALDMEEDVVALVQVMENTGFSHGKPVAAFTTYKCLWKYFEAETTTVFDRLIKIVDSAIKDQDNNNKMVYWLSIASTLLFLIHKSLKLDTASSVQKPPPPPPTFLFGKMKMAYLSSRSSVNLPDETEDLTAHDVLHLVEAKNPAMLFKQQLTTYVEDIYCNIHNKLKEELGALPTLCIQVQVQHSERFFGDAFLDNHWQSIVDCLDILLNTLKENFVPPVIVQKIFTQIFSYINLQLFNSLLLSPDCCTFSNGENVKANLAGLKRWCVEAREECVGSAWDKLQHIRQAIAFLTIHRKDKISFEEIKKNLCPILSIPQLYRICKIYSNPNYKTQLVSEDVISSMRIHAKEDLDDGNNNSFLLDDDFRIPVFVDDLSSSLQVKDFANIKPDEKLENHLDFLFLYN